MPEFERIREKTYQRIRRSLEALAYGILDFDDRITPDFSLACFDRWTNAVYWTTAHWRETQGETQMAIDSVALISKPIASVPEILTDHYPDDSLNLFQN